jgi:ACS family hexuronate transporter-like MFS transporter
MTSTIAPVRPATSQYRWVICALLFFATVISYVDRGVLGLLEKVLEGELHWDIVQYGYMTAGFQAAYAIGLITAGRLTDSLGTRRAFSYAMIIWSLAAMSRGAIHSTLAFGIAMFVLGLGEAANFPACIKTVAEWFPKRERALATGIFNSGANIGNIVTPALVPVLTLNFGWQGAFVITGLTGFVWLAFWLWLYRKPEEHPSVSQQELSLIHSDPVESKATIPWGRLIPRKETWAFAIGKFLTDPIWWFYLFWLPRYLQETFHLSLSAISTPVVVVYTISCFGSIGGGYISAGLLKRGYSANAARKIALLVCALAVVPVIYAPFAKNVWVVVGLVGLAAAAHQGWSANLFTLTSDLFPKAAVASVVGMGGMIGSLGGVLFQPATSYIVKMTGSYLPMFIIAGLTYLTALLVIQLLTPKLAPAKLD